MDNTPPLLAPAERPGRATLEETISLLESILEATHDAVLVLTLDGKIVRYNRQFLQMFGFTAERLESTLTADLNAALAEQLEDPSVLLAYSRRRWVNPSIESIDLLKFKDGRVYHRFVAPHRVKGRIVGRVASYRDITDLVSAQQALEQHRAVLEKAQEVIHVGSWVAELDGSNRLTCSRETCRIFGIDSGVFLGSSGQFFSYIHTDDRDFVRRISDAALAGHGAYDCEYRVVRADSVIRWVHGRADIIRDDRGTPLRMIGTVQDITDRRLLEEQLRQSQKLEAIGRLAGGIAHDLNNALTAIAGYTELALGALSQDHEARADVHEIRRAAERAESVTRQLLAFSRKQLLEPRLFSLGEVVAGLGRLLERLLGADIQVKTSIAAAPTNVYGDPGQIEQAIINLAVNARDAMPVGGSLRLEVSVVDLDEAFARAHAPLTAGRHVELAVIDTGEGMDAGTQAHVFEPFFTTKEVGKGTGLGLAMVYGTVQQSGGHIFVESAVGRGTTFRLYFPDARGSESVAAAQAAARPARTTGATVLVVEDEPSIRNLVVTALGHQGYRVLHASSGEEALAIAGADHGDIDLLLTDAKMPGMNGLELAATLVAQRPGLPVIVMSGYIDESLQLEGQPIPLLPKPFTPRELRQKVAEILGR